MQKSVLMAMFMLIFLCSCGNGEKEVTGTDTMVSLQTPDIESEPKEIPSVTVTEYSLPEEIATLEKLELRNMDISTDEWQYMYNSNQMNFGYFASDEEGNIYFSDFTQNAIFMCGPEGEGKKLLYEGTGTCMYAANGYLYFGCVEPEEKYIENVVKIDIHAKEAVFPYKNLCGEMMFLEDRMYFNVWGLCSLETGEIEGNPVMLSEIEPVSLNSDGRYLFYNIITEDTKLLFERGYLLAWDTETEKNYFVGSKMIFPLLAGDWLTYIDLQTNTRHVLDMRTGTDTDLEYTIQHVVSDGHKLYWAQQDIGSFQICQWDGQEIQELFTVEVEAEKYGDVCLYLTKDYLYWMLEIELMEEADWGYYRLADGKEGRLN